MPYRIERLALTPVRRGTRASTLARLSRRRTKLPLKTFSAFVSLARKLARAKLPVVAPAVERLTSWQRTAGAHRRNQDALREVLNRDAFAIVVPLLKGLAAPRMDELLRLLTGLELAGLLRKRGLKNVVTVGWPVLAPGDEAEAGGSAIIQRSGEIEDVGFSGGDSKGYLERLRQSLPGTGFSAWLIDLVGRSACEDPDAFKSRLLLKLFDDEDLAFLPSDATGDGAFEHDGFDRRLAHLGGLMSIIGVIRDGQARGDGGVAPLAYPSMSATMIEGKVEQWLHKFDLSAEEILAGEAKPQDLARKFLPRDLLGSFSRFKEATLGVVLRAELSLNELDFAPVAEVKRVLDGFDAGCDKLRQRALAEFKREEEINRKQLAKLQHYMLPVGQPQQNVVSLLHFLDFYGPEFLKNLRAVIQADDLRHQVVYLAPAKGVVEE